RSSPPGRKVPDSGCPWRSASPNSTADPSRRTRTRKAAPFSACTSRHGSAEPPMARILVVDDEVGIREFIGDVLVSDGHAVTEASNAQEALLHLNGAAFDVLLTDLRMPGAFDGMGLVRKARSDFSEMEVVVLTAHGTVDTAVEA